MSTALLFYVHITLTGVAIAAASYHFAGVVGAPAPRIYPVVRQGGGLTSAIVLWLLSGPIALLRYGFLAVLRQKPRSDLLAVAIIAALVWAFCLGVGALELVFRLSGA